MPGSDGASGRKAPGTESEFDPSVLGIDALTFANALLLGSSDGITVLDTERRIVFTNQAALRMGGRTLADVQGRTVSETGMIDDAGPRIQRALEGELLSSRTATLRTPSGDRLVSSTVTALRDPSGVIRGAIAITRDISEREASRRDAERNANLASLGRLVGGVAHEVRNPLFGISASLDAMTMTLAKETKASHASYEPFADAIRHEIENLRKLIDELLAYGRAPSGTRVSGPLRPVLDEALRATALTAASRNVTVLLTAQDDVPNVMQDAQRLPRLFLNVLDNALRVSPVGGTVEVRLSYTRGAPFVLVSIEDRGPGFPPGALAEAFQPFYSKRAGGTGLGLAIAAQITVEHGGDIEARAREGGGAIVEVRLPVCHEPTP